MKKILISLITIICFSIAETNAQAFTAKNFNLDIGASFGYRIWGGGNVGVLLSAEKGVHKWIGVGAYTGIQYNFGGFLYGSKYVSVPVGATGSFHFYQMISDLVGKEIGSDKLDIAIKHSLGVRVSIANPVGVNFDWGTSLLARYYFSEAIGIYAEVGYPVQGNAIVGLAVKF